MNKYAGDTIKRWIAPAGAALAIGLVPLRSGAAATGNWPMWRADAARSGAVSESLPKDLRLQWVREYPPPKDAWPDDASLPSPATNAYMVRLIFAEPDQIKAGERVFDVTLQGKPAIEKLDIVAAAGAPLTVLTREFRNIRPGAALTVELTPVKGEPVLCGLEFIAEPVR